MSAADPAPPLRAASVLLDLDGTLVDSASGILGSLRQAFDELGVPLPPGGLPPTLLGPPLYVTLPELVGEAVAPELLATYRRIYGEHGLLASPTSGSCAPPRSRTAPPAGTRSR